MLPLRTPDAQPWLRFEFNLAPITGTAWVTLGRCAWGLECIGRTAVFGADRAATLHNVWTTSAIVGTLSLDGIAIGSDLVASRLQGAGAIPRSRENEARVVDRLARALQAIDERARLGIDLDVSSVDLRALHAGAIDALESARPGEFRTNDFTVDLPAAAGIPGLVDGLCQWMNGIRADLPWGSAFVMPFLKATITHLYLLWLAPFDAGSGRIARLVEYDLLVRCGVPPVVAALAWSRYAADPARYARAVLDARSSPIHFVTWAAERYIEAVEVVLDAMTQSAIRTSRMDDLRALSRAGGDGRLRAAVLGATVESVELRGGRGVPRFEIERHSSVLAAAEGLPPGSIDAAIDALLDAGAIRVTQGLVTTDDARHFPFAGIDNPGMLPTAPDADYDSNVAWSGQFAAVRR